MRTAWKNMCPSVTRAMDRGLFACAQRLSARVFAGRSRRETVACLRGDGMRIEIPCRQTFGDNLVRLREGMRKEGIERQRLASVGNDRNDLGCVCPIHP
jgi:hypothetical protein